MNTRSADDLYKDPQAEPEVLPAFLREPPKTNDPKELKRKATDDKARELKQQNDIRAILTTEAGVRFMARLLGEICFIDAPAFHPNNSTMSNIAGRRQVGQTVKDIIRDTDFNLWVKVDRELEEQRPKMKKDR
jgi:hypothetical protein